jgi:hypothetical protein
MDPITKAFVASMEHFSKEHQIPMVPFQKGQRKDDVMKEHLARFEKPEGVVFIGKAQEKTPVLEKRRTRGLCAPQPAVTVNEARPRPERRTISAGRELR